jgi:hypothetical protein
LLLRGISIHVDFTPSERGNAYFKASRVYDEMEKLKRAAFRTNTL